MAWQDNFNIIYQSELPLDETRTWRFALEEHKTRGTLQLNVRLFKKTDTYDGPTKSGFVMSISSMDDVNQFKDAFNAFCETIKDKFD